MKVYVYDKSGLLFEINGAESCDGSYVYATDGSVYGPFAEGVCVSTNPDLSDNLLTPAKTLEDRVTTLEEQTATWNLEVESAYQKGVQKA